MGIIISLKSILILGIPLVSIVYLIRRKRDSLALAKSLFAVYLLCLFGITLLPIAIPPFNFSLVATINWIPFGDWFIYPVPMRIIITNILGNLVLLTPFGYFLKLLGSRLTSTTPRILAMGLIIPIVIETLQYFEAYFSLYGRSVDSTDVMLNFIGFVAGAKIAHVITEKNRLKNDTNL